MGDLPCVLDGDGRFFRGKRGASQDLEGACELGCRRRLAYRWICAFVKDFLQAVNVSLQL
jgi:hypothetical protein